jgi:hypothetical protein
MGMRVVGVFPSIWARAFFSFGESAPISGELVKEESPVINRVITQKSTASCQDFHPDAPSFAAFTVAHLARREQRRDSRSSAGSP